MKKASLAVACVLALIVTVFAQSTGQRRVGWANTVTELLSLTPSKEAYVYVTKGNLYSTNLDGKILAYDPSSTATVNNTNVWSPDSGIGRWLLISTLNGSGGGGGGAITLTVPDGFGVTGSPLTPPGTLGITSTLTNLAKGTGSGFSNAVASVDYVPPGPIGSSGLTMTGTNLLGRYSSGSGAIQTIGVTNGIEFNAAYIRLTDTGVTNGVYGSSTSIPQFSIDLNGRMTGATNVPFTITNPTDRYLPYNNAGTFADSPLIRIASDAIGINGETNVFGTDGPNLVYSNNAAAVRFYINSSGGNKVSIYNQAGAAKLEAEPGFTAALASGSGAVRILGSLFYPNGDATIVSGFDTARWSDVFSKSLTAATDVVSGTNYARINIYHATNSVTFNAISNGTNAPTHFAFQSNGVDVARINLPSGYTGTGTNFLSDDGTYKAVSGSGGTTINSTDGYLPYRTSSTTFGNSPWYRISTNSLGFNSTNYWLSSTASGVFIGDSVASASVAGANNVLIGQSLAANLSTGSRNVILGADNASTLQSGIQNVIIGYNSDVSSSAVSRSVLIGNGTSSEVDSGVAIGTNAKNPGVNTGVSIGSGANSSGSGGSGANVAIGGNALAGGTTASQTVSVGYGSLTSIQAKDNAVAMGYQAGFYSTDATLGVAIGYQAGIDATNIVQSVIIGGRPLRVNSRTARTVMDSVIIGHKPDAYTNDVASITNSIYIGSGLLPATNNVAQIGTNGVFVLYLNGDVGWFRGTGAPTSHSSGLVTNAPVGSMYSRLDGGMNSSFYVVETSSGNWVAK